MLKQLSRWFLTQAKQCSVHGVRICHASLVKQLLICWTRLYLLWYAAEVMQPLIAAQSESEISTKHVFQRWAEAENTSKHG